MTTEEAIAIIQKVVDDHDFNDEQVGNTAKKAIATIASKVSGLKSEMAILQSFYDIAIKERDYERSISQLTSQPSKWESDLH